MIPTLFDLAPPLPKHPAAYTDALLVTMAKMLEGCTRILDPFGGTGKVFLLEHWLGNVEIQAIEIQERWATKNPRTTLGNALYLPWANNYFDAINTSPTYGNRMADGLSTGKWTRITYADAIGEHLHPDNSGRLQWGNEYRIFHAKAWMEARRVLAPGGAFVLNIKDHIRAGETMRVTEWHIECLESLGFRMVDHRQVETPSMRYGQNGNARVPYESVIYFTLEATP